MSYKALYRTYRPQTFNDVTGQDVVVKTLQNAIKNNKISHAYLFCGPRGTGKTSIARIFAKALNCVNLHDGEPCDECVSCNEISQGINPDVIEIDAASNNGVDEIRDIREKVKYLPSGSKYKIYIIDEVHMLSGGAFNALLKTLEEPPKHVVFILATTEPQKLPATIISRCQRYEFKSLSVEEITTRLKQICELEDVTITEEALNSISEFAEGAMRDALSILDQAISYGSKNIDIDDISGVTGSLNFDKVIALGNAIEEKNVHGTLQMIHELISSGKEISKIINGLLVFYRDALLYKSVGDSRLTKYIFGKEQFQEFCNTISTDKIMYFVDVLCDVQGKVKYSTTPNIYLEIALIKMCNVSVEDLDVIRRLTELENKFNNLGSIEISSENISVDNDKLLMLETRVNQIINELNRLEIRKQIERIEELRVMINNITVNNNGNGINREIQNEISYIKDKIAEIELFVNKEESDSYNELVEKITIIEEKIASGLQTSNESVDLTDINSRIKSLEEKMSNINVSDNEVIEDIQETIIALKDDLDQLKEQFIEYQNQRYESGNIDISEISDKIMFLEKRMYQIVAGELATKKVVKKEPKKNNGQIMLFGDDVLSINDFEENKKENYDFGELQRQEELTETAKTEEQEVVEEIISEEEPVLEETYQEQLKEVEESVLEQTEEIYNEEPFVEEDSVGLFETTEPIIEPVHTEVKENKVVSKYFDMETQTEIIHKEHSSLVIKKKEDNPEYSLEQSIIKNEEVVETPVQEVKEEKPVQKPIIQPVVEEVGDKFATYDINLIAQILHDSISIEARNDKVRVEQVWKNMTRGARPEQLSIIETLQTGKVAVVGNKEFIIVFSSVSLCNIVMRKKFKEIALRILYNLLGDRYNYIALPIDVWSQKSAEYKRQYQIGIKYPTLTPLNIPGLEIIEDEYETESEKAINRTLRLFGKDNVKIE